MGLGVGISFFFFFLLPKLDFSPKKKIPKVNPPAENSDFRFAPYREVPVEVVPKVPLYSVEKNLANVANISDFRFSQKAREMLVKNGFVVIPSREEFFFSLYCDNKEKEIPSFVTTDSVLHSYHLVFDSLLKQLEEKKLLSLLKTLTVNMLNESLRQYQILQKTEWREFARRNVGFFAVGNKLLDPSAEIPSLVAEEVNQELALIERHEGMRKSPVMNIGKQQTTKGFGFDEAYQEDYSQYVPRGHYDRSEELKKYFKAMMWYGRISFRADRDDELKSALLMVLALNEEDNSELWRELYEPVTFFIGKSDDLTYSQFNQLTWEIYGEEMGGLKKMVKDKDRFSLLAQKVRERKPSGINTSGRGEEVAFRFMGQRFVIDTFIFQRLIYDAVGDKREESCEKFTPLMTNCFSGARCLPKGLDIPAAMGSLEAEKILEEMGETEYICYPERMAEVKKFLGSLNKRAWTENLYGAWLYQLRPLLTRKGNGYPFFMQNTAWARKDLNTFLGSWIELKHDTILYTKQAYSQKATAVMPSAPKDDRGYVEPQPHLYARLASLVKMTREGLESKGLLTTEMEESLKEMEQLALSLKKIAEKELNNEFLTAEEYELIRSYGEKLSWFWVAVNRREVENSGIATVVADIATNPDGGKVLEGGTGYISNIYVVVPVEGKLKIARGGVYSYYEFTWPMKDRLTDEKWREILDNPQQAQLPEEEFTLTMNLLGR